MAENIWDHVGVNRWTARGRQPNKWCVSKEQFFFYSKEGKRNKKTKMILKKPSLVPQEQNPDSTEHANLSDKMCIDNVTAETEWSYCSTLTVFFLTTHWNLGICKPSAILVNSSKAKPCHQDHHNGTFNKMQMPNTQLPTEGKHDKLNSKVWQKRVRPGVLPPTWKTGGLNWQGFLQLGLTFT